MPVIARPWLRLPVVSGGAEPLGHEAPAMERCLLDLGGAGERGGWIIEKTAHILGERALVALEREHIVGLLVDHLLGDLALAAHRIGGDDAAVEA